MSGLTRTVPFTAVVALLLAGCGVRTSLEVPHDAGLAGLDGAPSDAGSLDAAPFDGAIECRADAECDDRLACNGEERCVAARCVPGLRRFCADGIDCTRDECVEGVGCVNAPDDTLCGGAARCVPDVGCEARPCAGDRDCDDGLACNGVERCDRAAERCIASMPVLCDDGVACTIDGCREPSGTCESIPDDSRCPDGRACDPMRGCSDGLCGADFDCDDGLACNGAERCGPDGRCAPGSPVVCTDAFSCTDDLCDEALGATCVSRPDSSRCPANQVCSPVPGDDDGCRRIGCTTNAQCSDGSVCNGQERCSGGRCVAGAPLSCESMEECSVGSCSDATGGCVFQPRSPREVCDNGIEDDCDGLRDCDDGDCRGAPECECVPRSPSERVCFDGIDDDCDARVDCGDPDCRLAPGCFDAGPPPIDAGVRDSGARDSSAGDAAIPMNELGIAACTNGLDDDRDGRADCVDPDCRPFPMRECCNGIDDAPDDDAPADVFTCRCFDNSTCAGVSDFDQVCWSTRFSVCAPRCNFYGGDSFCRSLNLGMPRCNTTTGECVR